MASLQDGPAIFSTNLGRFQPREPAAFPLRIVLRSVPEDDLESKIAELRAKFPDQCRSITSPVANLYDYFDRYDQELHGAMFLRAVLEEIFGRNLLQKSAVFAFTQQWLRLNSTNFHNILSLGLDSAFTADDREYYGDEFLQDALGDLQLQKIKHDNTVAITYDGQYLPADSSTPNPGSARVTLPPEGGQQVDPSIPRNFSDSAAQSMHPSPPRTTPSAPASLPMFNNGFTGAPLLPALHHFGPGHGEQSRAHHALTQQYSPRGADNDGHGSNTDLPRYGFPDMFFAVPSPAMVPGQYPQYHTSSRPNRYNQTANRMPPFPKSKGPMYTGPSNDARILERQGVPKGRGALGERNPTHGNPYSFGPHLPQSREPPPSREGHYYGSLHNSAAPVITPSRLSNELSAEATAQGSSTFPPRLNEGMQYPPWESMPQPRVPNSSGLGEEHCSPSTPLGSLHRTTHIHEAPPPSGRTDGESALPAMMQGPLSANQMGSQASRRFSSNMNPSHGANTATQYAGRHYVNIIPRDRRHSTEERHTQSDRKVWIGGLPQDTQVGALTELLEPFGPHELSNLLVSRTGNMGKEFAGFAFAEFQHSQHASNAVEGLNGKDVASLNCQLCVRPAFIKAPYSHQTNLAPKGAQAYTGRNNFHDVENDHRRCFDDRVPQIPRDRTMQTQQNQQNADLPQVGKDSYLINAPFPLPTPPRVPSSKNHVINGTHGYYLAESNVRDHKSVTAGIGSPSPSKKKKGRVNKDGSLSGKESQVKTRKEMLSHLRTEKSSGANADEVVIVRNPPKNPNDDAPEPTVSVIQGQADLSHQEKIKTFSGVSASHLKDELEHYSQPQHEEIIEELSPVHTTSSMGRRRSSASLIIMTDLTSYAQSERSGSGTDLIQTPVTPTEQAKSGKIHPVLTDSALSNGTVPHLSSETGKMPCSDTTTTPVDRAVPISPSHPEPQRATMMPKLKDQADHPRPADKPPATFPTSYDSSVTHRTQEVKIDTRPDPGIHEQSKSAESKYVEDPVLSDMDTTTLERPRRTADLGTASLDHLSPKRATTGPMQDMSPNTKLSLSTGPMLKHGIPRDPKTLIAVPKILAPIKPKVSPGNPDAHVSMTEETHDGGRDITSELCPTTTKHGGFLDPSQSHMQSDLATIASEEAESPIDQSSNQQPVIQQKKRKIKKSKKAKKPKPSQASSANGSSPTHSRSSTKEEIKVSEIKEPTVAPKAETPYLADDNTPLPQPSFVRHNHSSMRSRIGPLFKSQAQNLQNGSGSIASPSSASTARERQFYIFSKSQDQHVWPEEPGEPLDLQSSQNEQPLLTQVEDEPQTEDSQRTLSLDEQQARLKVLDSHAISPIQDILHMLHEVVPPKAGLGIFKENSASEPRSDGRSDTLRDVSDSRLVEIDSDEEAQPASQPSAIPEPQTAPLVPQAVSSSPTPACDKSVQSAGSFRNLPEIEQPVYTDGSMEERGQGYSNVMAKGTDLSKTGSASIKSENVSPSRKEPPKTPSWKEIVTKSSTPSLQTGDIVEFFPRETDGEGKGLQTPGIVRKSATKHPWRVPSAEQPWGKNSKSK
ncbi:MAG: hypothetical protein Q9169_006611 [Polycauliona sp. 2 TL-2023]